MVNTLFSVGLGLDTPLPPTSTEKLPEAKNLVNTVSDDIKVDELYSKNSFQEKISQPFDFIPKNKTLLQPYQLQNNLEKLGGKLQNINDSTVSEFLNKDVVPLLNNNDLLRTYCSLLLN